MAPLPAAIERANTQREIARIFARHGIKLSNDPSELVLTDLSVTEPTWSRSISSQILDRIFPKTGSTDALHFTLPHVLPSLIEHKALWLASVTKNLKEGEYEAFAAEHGFASAESEKIRKELAGNYFYTSFSPVGTAAEPGHWSMFAGGGLGFCMRFHIEPKAADLRRMRYQNGEKTLYAKINEALKASVNRVLVPWGVARLSAFYLDESYADEDELRLLVSNPPVTAKFAFKGSDYIAIRLEYLNPWCHLTLKEVICGQSGDVKRVRELLRRFGFDDVDVRGRS